MADFPGPIERLNGTNTSDRDLNVDEENEDDGNTGEQEGNERGKEGGNEEKRDENQHGKSNSVMIFAVKTGTGLILLFMVLSCITFSKLTLIGLADRLRTLTVAKNVSSDSEEVNVFRGVCLRS